MIQVFSSLPRFCLTGLGENQTISFPIPFCATRYCVSEYSRDERKTQLVPKV